MPIERGQAVLLTSSLRHAGGSNSTDNNTAWKYCLFAYIVLETIDFLSEVTRLNLNQIHGAMQVMLHGRGRKEGVKTYQKQTM